MQKSRQLGQNYISPEHIVLALFVSGDSAVKAVIEKCVSHPMHPINSPPRSMGPTEAHIKYAFCVSTIIGSRNIQQRPEHVTG